jgi:predicted nucleotidyltransferase
MEAGRTFLYTLNWDHLLASAVEQMAEARLELTTRLSEVIGSWEISAVHASLFGSTARGDGDIDSDIDLFVVRPANVGSEDFRWHRQLDDLAEAVRSWTGNSAGIVEVGEEDLPRLRRDRPAVVAELERDAIDLSGDRTRTLLRRT